MSGAQTVMILYYSKMSDQNELGKIVQKFVRCLYSRIIGAKLPKVTSYIVVTTTIATVAATSIHIKIPVLNIGGYVEIGSTCIKFHYIANNLTFRYN